MRYRKKPVEVEAHPVADILDHWGNSPSWVLTAIKDGRLVKVPSTPPALHVTTLEGHHVADYDDMLIQGVQGELYGCKPDIFAATYEPVS
jgi:hypothetical protein